MTRKDTPNKKGLRGSHKTIKKKRELLNALESSLCVITTACKLAKIERKTYYRWLESDPFFAEMVDDLSDIALDFAETKLFEKINGVQMVKHGREEDTIYEQAPSDTAIIFYLKTKGKKRGYIERQEVEQQNHIDFKNDPFAQIRKNAGLGS